MNRVEKLLCIFAAVAFGSPAWANGVTLTDGSYNICATVGTFFVWLSGII